MISTFAFVIEDEKQSFFTKTENAKLCTQYGEYVELFKLFIAAGNKFVTGTCICVLEVYGE